MIEKFFYFLKGTVSFTAENGFPERMITPVSYTHLENGVDMVDVITLCFEGCIASLQSTILTNVEQSLQICGTKGRIKIPDPHYSERCMRFDANGLAEEFYQRRDNGFQYEIREMVSCIQQGKLESEIMPHRDTLRCAEIFEFCLNNK